MDKREKFEAIIKNITEEFDTLASEQILTHQQVAEFFKGKILTILIKQSKPNKQNDENIRN